MQALGIRSTARSGGSSRCCSRRSSTSLLIRLLVVDTGALSWAEMGVRRLGRAALGEMAGARCGPSR